MIFQNNAYQNFPIIILNVWYTISVVIELPYLRSLDKLVLFI